MKSSGAIIFYIFIILFIVLAYLNTNGFLPALFSQTTPTPAPVKRNIIEMAYKEKEYRADYSKKYDKTGIDIAGFEEGEKWKGDYKIDNSNYHDGKSSYVLFSKDNQPAVLSLPKNLNLSDYSIFKMLVYIANEENINNLQNLTLRLGPLDNSAYYEYNILNIHTGWNIVSMSKDNFTLTSGLKKEEAGSQNPAGSDRRWEKIEKISVELNSRPNTQVELSVDRLWAEKNEEYKKDFRTSTPAVVSPKTWNGKTYMNFWSLGGSSAYINKVAGVKNFTYTAKIIPQKAGAFGISARTDMATGYGYYLEMGGIDAGTWNLHKIGKVVKDSSTTQLDNGELANFLIEPNQPVWLRLSTQGSTIAGYFSTDGINFTKLTEKTDGELKSGGIGLQTSGSFLLESIEFKQ